MTAIGQFCEQIRSINRTNQHARRPQRISLNDEQARFLVDKEDPLTYVA